MESLTHQAPLLYAMEQGISQFAPVWRAYSSQFTQPEILKLHADFLQTRAVHSSQIGSFKTASLTEPGPKVFVALGYVNVALARSNGHPEHLIDKVADIGYPTRLPDSLKPIWIYRTPLLDANGVAMGPTGLFEAFCGLRELPAHKQRSITPTEAPTAAAAIGAFLRIQLPTLGVDWLEELDTLTQQCPTMRPLLLRETVDTDRLLQDLSTIARIAGTSTEKLWEVIERSLGR